MKVVISATGGSLAAQVGENARRALQAAGLRIVEGILGQVQSALDAWLRQQPA